MHLRKRTSFPKEVLKRLIFTTTKSNKPYLLKIINEKVNKCKVYESHFIKMRLQYKITKIFIKYCINNFLIDNKYFKYTFP